MVHHKWLVKFGLSDYEYDQSDDGTIIHGGSNLNDRNFFKHPKFGSLFYEKGRYNLLPHALLHIKIGNQAI